MQFPQITQIKCLTDQRGIMKKTKIDSAEAPAVQTGSRKEHREILAENAVDSPQRSLRNILSGLRVKCIFGSDGTIGAKSF
jgi:hypothetical protein